MPAVVLAACVGLLAIILLGCQGLFAPPPMTAKSAVPVVMPLPATASQPPVTTPEERSKTTRPARVLLESVPPVTTDNMNSLIDKHRKDLTFSASSTFPGWPE